MKLARIGLAIATLLLVIPTAIAKDKNQANFQLTETVQVGSTQLQPGNYKAEWKSQSGNNIQIEIIQHGKTVATTQGTLKDLSTPAANTAITTKPNAANSKQLEEIDFSGHEQALVFGE
jgi:hypothetical protein